MSRITAGFIACLGWFALGLQFSLDLDKVITRGLPLITVVAGFFSFFTIISNLLIALCLTGVALAPDRKHFWNQPFYQTALAVYIIVVAAVYAALLQDLWDPHGLTLLADRLFHKVLPVLYVSYWLMLAPRGTLRFVDPLWWQIFPFLYMTYTLARGAVTGDYPYPFLNVARMGYSRVLWNGLLLLALLLTTGILLVILDKALAAIRNKWSRNGLLQKSKTQPMQHPTGTHVVTQVFFKRRSR